MKIYQLTEQEFEEQTKLQQPIPLMMTHIIPPEMFEPQYYINLFWKKMADKYGFIVETMRPAQHLGLRCFKANERPQ